MKLEFKPVKSQKPIIEVGDILVFDDKDSPQSRLIVQDGCPIKVLDTTDFKAILEFNTIEELRNYYENESGIAYTIYEIDTLVLVPKPIGGK